MTYVLRLKDARRHLTVLIVCLCANAANATDLLEAYYRAKASDPTYAAAQATLEAIRQKIPQARSDLLPLLRATGNEGATSGDTAYTDTPRVQRSFNSYSWAIQLSQPLLRLSAIYAFDESKALVEQGAAEFLNAQQDLLLRVTQAYFDVLVAQETQTAADAQLHAMQEQQAAAKRSYEKGVASVTDLDEATSRAELARAQQLMTSSDVETKQAELERITGPLESLPSSLRDEAILNVPEPNDLSQWIVHASEGNPALIAQKAALQVASYEVSRVRAQRSPTIDLTASYGSNYSSGNIINPVDYATRVHDKEIGVQVALPLIDGGALHAQVHEAQAKHTKVEADVEAARRRASSDVRAAFVGLHNGLQQITALRSAVAAGENAVRGNERGYLVGLKINSDVLGAQQQLYAAKRDLAKARYDTLMQGLKLKAAAGVLREQDLALVNAQLIRPVDHP